MVEIRTEIKTLRVASDGIISDEDLAVLQEWVDRSAKA